MPPDHAEGRPRWEAASEPTDSEKVGTANDSAPWEPSSWFRRELARVRAKAHAMTPPGLTTHTTLIIPLRHSLPGSREDRCCDRCRRYVPPTDHSQPPRFHVGGHRFEINSNVVGVMSFGLCERCRRLEGLPVGRVIS